MIQIADVIVHRRGGVTKGLLKVLFFKEWVFPQDFFATAKNKTAADCSAAVKV